MGSSRAWDWCVNHLPSLALVHEKLVEMNCPYRTRTENVVELLQDGKPMNCPYNQRVVEIRAKDDRFAMMLTPDTTLGDLAESIKLLTNIDHEAGRVEIINKLNDIIDRAIVDLVPYECEKCGAIGNHITYDDIQEFIEKIKQEGLL